MALPKRAIALGFTSRAEWDRFRKLEARQKAEESLSSRQRETLRKVKETIRQAASYRDRGIRYPLTKLAREMGTTVASIRRYAPEALKQRSAGRALQVAQKPDILRKMTLITPLGPVTVQVGAREASLIGKHHDLIGKVRSKNKETRRKALADLNALEGRLVTTTGGPVPLATSLDDLAAIELAGGFDVENPVYPDEE